MIQGVSPRREITLPVEQETKETILKVQLVVGALLIATGALLYVYGRLDWHRQIGVSIIPIGVAVALSGLLTYRKALPVVAGPKFAKVVTSDIPKGTAQTTALVCLSRICGFCDERTAAIASRVCRSWNQAFSPLLSQVARRILDPTCLVQAFEKKGRIRALFTSSDEPYLLSLKERYRMIVQKVLPHLSRIHGISLSHQDLNNHFIDSFTGGELAHMQYVLLQQGFLQDPFFHLPPLKDWLPALTFLYVSDGYSGADTIEFIQQLPSTCSVTLASHYLGFISLSLMPSLTQIVSSRELVSMTTEIAYLNDLKRLASLQVTTLRDQDNGAAFAILGSQDFFRLRLKEFCVRGNKGPNQSNYVLKVVPRAKQLETLVMDPHHQCSLAEAAVLSWHPTLTHLSLSISETGIPDSFTWSAQLRTMDLVNVNYRVDRKVDGAISSDLLRCISKCRTLVALSLDVKPTEEKTTLEKDVVLMLRELPHLRSLFANRFLYDVVGPHLTELNIHRPVPLDLYMWT